jgi:16S rRNA (uracil1498-N3)-methyltransferase
VHRLFVPPDRPGELTSEQTRYLRTVLRLKTGDEIEVFDGRGGRFRAWLEEGSLRLGEKLPQEPARADEVTLVQALAKGEKMDLVVQKATELGVARIVPLASERSIVKLDAARAGSRTGRWRKVAQEAARQSQRTDVPRIDEPVTWDGVFTLGPGLLLDPEERTLRLGQAARGVSRVLIAVGPEGGFSPEERERAVQAGMLPVGLGPLVLRTETAGLAALAVILHVNGELG